MRTARLAFLRGLLPLWACLFTLILPPPARAALTVVLGRVDAGSFVLEGVELLVPEGNTLPGSLTIRKLNAAGRHWRDVGVDCGQMQLSGGQFRCSGGRVRGVAGLEEARLTLEADASAGRASGTVAWGGGKIVFRRESRSRVSIGLSGITLRALARLVGRLPEGMDLSGRLNGTLTQRNGVWAAGLKFNDLSFSDASGMRAGEALELAVSARAEIESPENAAWQIDLNWSRGDMFWNPVLLASGWQLTAQGHLAGDELRVDSARISGPGLASVGASGAIDVPSRSVLHAQVDVTGADLAQLVPQFVLPVYLPDQMDRWRVAGSASGHLSWASGALQSAALALDDAGFSYLGQRFRVGPIKGNMPWRRGQRSRWTLEVDGLHWQSLSFAPFSVAAAVSDRQLVLEPARLPLLDGAIVIDALNFVQTDDHWRGTGSFYAEPISLAMLTEALELPSMSGTVSIAAPGITVTPDRLGMSGAMVISLFDGYVQATDLQVADPFGLLPRLTADISAEHLDLAQLTQTFSFGSVSGFIDASVDDLVLAKWKPVSFDARVRSSSGDYERRISQRAVENITALGGAGAMAAVQRSVLRLFSDFGYREIGLSCQLRGNVCRMAGLEGDGEGEGPFRVVAGGGIPALDVIGYNRRVDWAELVDRLERAISDGAEPIVK